LDPDDAIALAATRGLAASAARGGLDPVSRRRIDVIRPWLHVGRRHALDRAFPATAAAHGDADKRIVKTIASACDGSGAASLIATIRRGARFDIASVMTKSFGIADSFVLQDLSKADANTIE